eukprot:SAG22_NODE_1333_length_4674_cov_5.765319_2_plen_183_part_00
MLAALHCLFGRPSPPRRRLRSNAPSRMTVVAAAANRIAKDSQFVPAMPVLGAAYRSVRYHFGSAIFGGAILALVRLARYIAMYIDAKTAELQKQHLWVRVVMKLVHCCLWCLEKCLRFLVSSAYILVAIEGRSFCRSAWRSFKLLFSNSLRVATTVAISKVIIVLARLGIIGECSALCSDSH